MTKKLIDDDFYRKFEELKPKKVELPKLPKDLLKWIEEARPFIGNERQSFLAFPMWPDVYRDNNPLKMIVGGRQIAKSTYITNILGFETTAFAGTEAIFVTYDDISKSGFSRQRYQYGTFEANPKLKLFTRHGVGNVGEVSLKNKSVTYLTIDHDQYRHVEGKSPDHILLDEAQYQDIQYFDKIVLAMTQTKGKITICGVGGESGSPYEEMWRRTDQREWIYDDSNWRDKLQFGLVKDRRGFEKRGLIIGEYLKEVLRGHWEIKNPSAVHWHGYHLPQTIFPTIPLTIESAINDYDVDPIYSIEWRRKHLSGALYSSHVIGGFYKAERRPITNDMIENCMKNYNYLQVLTPEQIGDLKETYGRSIEICMGVDFGSGQPSKTVIAIFIIWKLKESEKVIANAHRIQLVLLEQRPKENQLDQAEYINWMFKIAKCDVGIGDLGYGANQIMVIQEGGYSRKDGKSFKGVGATKFIGAKTMGDETKPLQQYVEKEDEHGKESPHITLNKTAIIQQFIDFLEEYIPHPNHPFIEEYQRSRFMIPNHPNSRSQIDFIFHDWTSLVRIDLPEELEVEDIDKRQFAKKLYSHPADSLMSCVFAHQASRISAEYHWVSIGDNG